MNIQHYKPKNKTLDQYIEGYYFMTKGKSQLPIRYLTFPNNLSILSTSQNAKVKIEDNRITVSPTNLKGLVTDLVVSYTEPIEVFYEVPVNEITVKFKPLGINHFIDNSTLMFSKRFHMNFQPFDDLNKVMENIFNICSRELQISQLEDYWLSKLKNEKLNKFQEIVNDVEGELSIAEVAIRHKISRQYLSRNFMKHLGKTPSEYRKIHKFRKALINFQKVNNLTELSYENLFYDQSHFIKDFKSLTNIKPSAFFKQVDENKDVAWIIL